MNPKQLTHVLIKIGGLWFCAKGLLGVISGILSSRVLSAFPSVGSPAPDLLSNAWIYIAPSLISFAIGAYFILSTRKIVDWLLKDL